MKLGIIADDITGSNDIGLMCTSSKASTVIYNVEDKIYQVEEECLIINTNSRINSISNASKKVNDAFNTLLNQKCDVFYKKTCSVFRGNIGAEFDQVQTRTGETMHVVLGFPDMGRTTVGGTHYVDGVLISESQFATDPVNPITTSSLCDIIGLQSKGKCGEIYATEYYNEQSLIKKIDQLEKTCDYIVYDVRNNEDLKLLARVLNEKKVFGGASAFCKYLWKEKMQQQGKLICVGSMTPQSLEQVRYMEARAVVHYLTIEELLINNQILQTEISKLLNTGINVILSTSKCQTNQIENEQISYLAAKVTSNIVKLNNLENLIVAGGETSNFIAQNLNIVGQKIIGEVSTGVALCKAVNKKNFSFVFKSGSFGERDFFERAINMIEKGNYD